MHSVAGSSASGSVSHHNGFHSYLRNSSQRAAALEIHFKFGQLGSSASQFGSPHGFCIASDDSIIVADTNNHRIQVELCLMLMFDYVRDYFFRNFVCICLRFSIKMENIGLNSE